MPKLPHLNRRLPPKGEAGRLSRWFRERDLEQRLRREDANYAEPLHPPPLEERNRDPKLADLVARFDPEVKVGQIRILHGGMFAEMRRPLHVAILSEWPPASANSEEQAGGQQVGTPRNIIPLSPGRAGLAVASQEATGEKTYLVAPFGDYCEPATNAEWLTGRDAGPLRVLCLWNTRDYPARWLELSWIVGELTEQELAGAWDVFRHALTNVPLSDRLREQVGAPIIHPRDPRLAYQAEETRLFTIVPEYAEHRWRLEEARKPQIDKTQTGHRTVQPQSPVHGRGNVPLGFEGYTNSVSLFSEEDQLALAAQTQATPETARFHVQRWRAPIQTARLLLTRHADQGKLKLVVFGADNKPSNIFHDCQIVSPRDREEIAKVRGFEAILAVEKLCQGFVLIALDGTPVKLEPDAS